MDVKIEEEELEKDKIDPLYMTNPTKIKLGTTQFCRKELTALDAIDIITKSLKCGKLNNSTRIKIIDNVVKELKAFYD